MSDIDHNGLSDRLRRLIETVDLANLLTEPLTNSIRELLTVSANELNSAEASVLVRDGNEGDLKFLAAIGQVAEQLLDLTIPAGKGIAGFVLSSGQPMAVSDVGETDAFYAEVDRSTGYSTRSILATPLTHGGEVIGVLEYINRSGGPPFEPFSPAEMDRAALFANAISSLVNAHESAKLFRELGQKIIDDDGDMNVDEVRDWLTGIRAAPEHREMMSMAVVLREIAGRGEAERQMCKEILDTLLKFSDRRAESGYLTY